MTVLIVFMILLPVVGLGYFLYKNQQDKRELQKLLRDTQAEDEAHDKTDII
ncbi:MAG: hypothetical protein KDI83_18240 [Gammaproteobacteria bacterium]|nr:hypothetical protein [Gammaproteobacteria bacterium]